MSDAVEGPVAVVVGRSGARLEALCAALPGHAQVLGIDDEATGRRLVEQVRASGRRAEFIYCDFARAADLDLLVAATLEAFGRIDLALVAPGHGSAGTLDRAVTAFAPVLREQRGGQIVCVTEESEAADPVVAAALARGLAAEGVRLNAISVGAGAATRLEQAAQALAWLAGETALGVSGTTVHLGLGTA